MVEYQTQNLRFGRRRGEWPEVPKCCWHPTEPLVFVYEEVRWNRVFKPHGYVKFDDDHADWRGTAFPLRSASLQAVNASGDLEVVFELHIPCENRFGALVGLEHHPASPFLLVIWEHFIQIWDYEKRRMIGIRALSQCAESGYFRKNPNQVSVILNMGGRAAIWDCQRGCYQEFNLLNHDVANFVCLHPSDELLLVSSDWDWQICQAFFHYLGEKTELSFITKAITGQEGVMMQMCFSLDGKMLSIMVAESLDSKPFRCYVRVYDVLSQKVISTPFMGDSESQQNLLFFEGGGRLAFSQKNQVKVLAAFGSDFSEDIHCHTPIKHLAASPKWGKLAITHEGGCLTVATREHEIPNNEIQSWHSTARNIADQILTSNQNNMRLVSEGIRAEDFRKNNG